MDEQGTQISVAALGNPQQPRPAARRMLSRYKAEPSAQVTGAPEGGGIANGGDKRGRVEHAHTWDRDKPARGIILTRQLDELAVQGLDACVKRAPLSTGVGDEFKAITYCAVSRAGDFGSLSSPPAFQP